jgi:tetratricopeptide (TPR) repeat protein
MLTGRHINDFKIIIILLALSTALLAVPILAKQQRNNSRNSSNSSRSARNQQVKQASKAPTRIAPIVRSSKPQIISGVSRNKGLSGLGRAPKSNTNQPGMIISNRQTNGATFHRRLIPQLQSSISVRVPSNIKMPTGVSSSIVKRNNVSSDNNRNSDRTSRFSNQITTNPSTQLRPAPSKAEGTDILQSTPTIIDSRTRPGEPLSRSWISSNRTLDIASLIGRQDLSSLRTSKSQLSGQTRGIRSDFRTRLNEALSRNRTRSDDSSRQSAVPEPGILSRSRIGSSIINRQSSAESQATENQAKHRSSGLFRALGSIGKKRTGDRAEAERTHKSINLRVVDSLRLSPRPRKSALEIRANTSNANPPVAGYGGSSKVYHEYPPVIINKHRYEHIYWDYHNQLRHRIIWPKYHFTVCYTHGPYFTFRYVYPYHLRRYIFVSLGGYWPLEYGYIRYYWYGCHPYQWYGYYPIAHEVTGDTYNYFTYNYYYSDDGTVSSVSAQGVDGIKPVDHNTFADVREKLAKEPDVETTADIYFDEAVKAFEAGDYETAIMKFAEAKELATDDTVLPFAYSQALFANEQYAEAAEVLRSALENVSPEKEGVFYPRGLYSDDETLFEQIKNLSEKAELYSFDADLQLLLGYHLLGTGEIDKAIEPLQNASQDLENAEAATILLDLLTKISPDSGGQETDTKAENAEQ